MAEKANQASEAERAYRQAIAARPDFVDAHYNLGFLLKAKEEIPAAIQEFQQVVKLKPDYADAFVNLGVLYSTQKKIDQAEQAYEEAIRLKPAMAEAYYNLGVFYEFHLKDTSRALVTYKKYLEVGGKDDRIQRIVRDMRK